MTKKHNTHGTGILVAHHGILLTGVSGAGKSLLALDLLEQAQLRGEDAFLISDDRVDLSVDEDGLVMEPPATIEGMIELRGRGIIKLPYAKSAHVHLVVEFVDTMERLLEESELTTQIHGIWVPRCPVPRRGLVDGLHQRFLVHAALRSLGAIT
ncbi:HPr kinase/phosphorylase [Pelagibacterium halotolerans]|uniref:HPr kinase/phosphorylase n=1 Tax=Pelagibacterium halotolerans TaxID=531813 RepID=UPI00384C9CDC